jgi:signal transduction histidine kinase
VVRLQQAPDTKRLGELLSGALHDPSLELVYWLPGFECYVDASGRPVTLPTDDPRRAVTPIDHDGDHVAALVHDAALAYEPELLEVVCAAANVALERERLQAELESRVEELAGSRARLVAAGDEARRRIERDLHDGAQQRLVSLAIALRLTENRIREDPEAAVGLVAAARKEVSESLAELRELARGIHPAVLEHGLEVALDSLATRSRTPVTVSFDLDERLPAAIELAAYFVASEALANVGKYAQASRASVRVFRADSLAVIEVSDDGIGGADAARGSGLRGLDDRVAAVGGPPAMTTARTRTTALGRGISAVRRETLLLLLALGLIVNAIVLYNTIYTQRALDHLAESGQMIDDADIERLSPLGTDHITLTGRYRIALLEGLWGGPVQD